MVDIGSAGALLLHEGGRPDWLALAGGSAWGAGNDGIQQMDGKTGTDIALIPVVSICTAMDTGFDALWVADCDHSALIRIDPKAAKVTGTYPLKSGSIAEEGSVGAGEGAVWVATTSSTLVRFDPRTGAQTAFPLPVSGSGVRAGLGSVWLTVPDSDDVLRVDPKTGSVIATIRAGRGPRFLTIGGDSVWVQNNGDGTVTRIGADGTITATIPVSLSPVDGGDIAAGGGFVWPRISAALVAKLDVKTGALLATYGPPSGSGSVAADAERRLGQRPRRQLGLASPARLTLSRARPGASDRPVCRCTLAGTARRCTSPARPPCAARGPGRGVPCARTCRPGWRPCGR